MYNPRQIDQDQNKRQCHLPANDIYHPIQLCIKMKKQPFRTLISAFFLASVCFASAFSTAASAQEVKGDAASGKVKNAMCVGCHGIEGLKASFPQVYSVPKISGQNAKYIVSALNAYKKGERKHPTMVGISSTLSDQDIADLAAFYGENGQVSGAPVSTQPNIAASESVNALLQKGGCTGCHGASFANSVDPSYPKIAGQPADYLYASLKAYKTPGNAKAGRANPIMAGMVQQYSNKDLAAIAAYISSLETPLKIVPQSKFR